jgi:hypothetical protein
VEIFAFLECSSYGSVICKAVALLITDFYVVYKAKVFSLHGAEALGGEEI